LLFTRGLGFVLKFEKLKLAFTRVNQLKMLLKIVSSILDYSGSPKMSVKEYKVQQN